MIFESQSACIGFVAIFDLLGLTFMVDVRYRKMAVFAKEKMFSTFTGLGVSLYYPGVVGEIAKIRLILTKKDSVASYLNSLQIQSTAT